MKSIPTRYPTITNGSIRISLKKSNTEFLAKVKYVNGSDTHTFIPTIHTAP
jgi:hypothetical protein